MFEYIFGLIAPHLCIICGKEGSLLCPGCTAQLPALPHNCYRCGRKLRQKRICGFCRTQTPLDELVAVTTYRSAAKIIIQKLKFERASAAAEPIARLLAVQAAANLVGVDAGTIVVTHAPTANRRVRMRGYDQSARIAKQVAKILGVPHRSLLYRLGNTRQVGASKEQRQAQVQDVFRLRPTTRPIPQYVVLVDDVITTGATLESAAVALKQAGANKVTALVFAAV